MGERLRNLRATNSDVWCELGWVGVRRPWGVFVLPVSLRSKFMEICKSYTEQAKNHQAANLLGGGGGGDHTGCT